MTPPHTIPCAPNRATQFLFGQLIIRFRPFPTHYLAACLALHIIPLSITLVQMSPFTTHHCLEVPLCSSTISSMNRWNAVFTLWKTTQALIPRKVITRWSFRVAFLPCKAYARNAYQMEFYKPIQFTLNNSLTKTLWKCYFTHQAPTSGLVSNQRMHRHVYKTWRMCPKRAVLSRIYCFQAIANKPRTQVIVSLKLQGSKLAFHWVNLQANKLIIAEVTLHKTRSVPSGYCT